MISIVSLETLLFKIIGYFIHTRIESFLCNPLLSFDFIFCCVADLFGLDNFLDSGLVSISCSLIVAANRVKLRADAIKVRGCHILSRRLFNFLHFLFFFIIFLRLWFWSQFEGFFDYLRFRCDRGFSASFALLHGIESWCKHANWELVWLTPVLFSILLAIAVTVIFFIEEDLAVGYAFSIIIGSYGWSSYSRVIVIAKLQLLHWVLLRKLLRIAYLRRVIPCWVSLVHKHLCYSCVVHVHLGLIETVDVQIADYCSSAIAHLSFFLLFCFYSFVISFINYLSNQICF